MIVDCAACPVRGVSCDSCVINVLFAPEVATVEGSAATPHALPVRPVADHGRQEMFRRLREAGRVRPLWAVPDPVDEAEKYAG